MYKQILARIRQGHRTIRFPKAVAPALPDRFRGRPCFDARLCRAECRAECRACSDACPVGAIDPLNKSIDLGKCIFCTDCMRACPGGAVAFSGDYRLAARSRRDLVITVDQETLILAQALDRRMKGLFGRSLKLRQVSAGGCGACEADVSVLGTIGWDWGRFGIQFVASPRHADGILVTGPVTKNMELALRKTWDAIPGPKIVIASGSCAIAGGPYAGHDQVLDGVESILPVDLYIPGCPPHPLTTLDGLLRLLGKIGRNGRVSRGD
ncbi:MAG: NADH-quinone oxidoreductase subunit NuoB [Spirochaetes bacterium]|nr:NADH-quinone oxidoreductase subunit NuoB [Spirochaetota bacterium]